MSRSRRKTKIFGNCKGPRDSEKKDKQICNRILRSRIKQQLNTCNDWDGYVVPNNKEAYNSYNFCSDGRHYWGGAQEKFMRK